MSATITEARPAEVIELQERRSESTQINSTAPPTEIVPNEALDADTLAKLLSAAFAFFTAGVNDGSWGALLPYILREYHVSTSVVSTTYAASFMGWLLAALTNSHLCQYLDLGSMLAVGAGLQFLCQALRVWRPPFALFVITFGITALGQGFQDSHANTYVADVKAKAHRWLGLIHASYAAGLLVGPFTGTAVASSGGGTNWPLTYCIPLSLGVMNLVFVAVAFRDRMRFLKRKNPDTHPTATDHDSGLGAGDASATAVIPENKKASEVIKATVQSPNVWLLGLFYFFYLGAAFTASGWVVEYLVDVRDGDVSKVGYVPAGFNGGTMLGRLLLPEPIHRFGERYMIFAFCLVCVGFQLLFWLVPNIIAASVAISFVGFFSGPFFATGMSVGSKLFELEIRSDALALVFVIAQIGASIFPVLTGLIAVSRGVAVMQPMLIGLFSATAISWLLVPRPKSTGNSSLHQD